MNRRVVRGVSELYTPFDRVEDAAFVVDDGRYAWVGPAAALPADYAGWPTIDLGGSAVIPGLVDSHTHLVWAGSRVDEYVRRSAGVTYQEIAAEGGGILATVEATRAMSDAGLMMLARRRAAAFQRGGVTARRGRRDLGTTRPAEAAWTAPDQRLR